MTNHAHNTGEKVTDTLSSKPRAELFSWHFSRREDGQT
jgi:hypothetical protein